MRAAIDLAWNALASEVAAAADRAPEVESAVLPLRARISVRAGLGNLATGLRPPATGHDNPHYFDDAACVRAGVLAVVHPGDPAAAAELAEFDARYTQDGDGVHGARAMAAAVAAALGGADVDDLRRRRPGPTPRGHRDRPQRPPRRSQLAPDAPGARQRLRARPAPGARDRRPRLQLRHRRRRDRPGRARRWPPPPRGRIAEAVPAAACLSRVADSAPALAGALTGAIGGGDGDPGSWRDACRTLSGCALPRLAGTDLVELAELLEATRTDHAQEDDSDA